MVLLEVQMHPDPGFHPRLAAQSYRFLQKHPRAEHLEVVVITPNQRHKLVPLGYRDSFNCFWARCTGSAWKL